jgi:uncharacterized protein YycO
MMLVLCTHSGFGAWFLRTVMWSKYSHAAILDGNTVTDTTFCQGGVKQHHAKDFFEHYKTFELREIEVDETIARLWLADQVGKGYDWTALLSFVVQRNWQEPDKWFCSELCEAMIDKFGKPRFRASASRVTPRHQEMLA